MTSREQFEHHLTGMVKNRAVEAANPSELVFMLDVLCANALMLVGAAEKGCVGTPAIKRIIDRLEQVEQMRKSGAWKSQSDKPIIIEGDPVSAEEQPKLVDFTPKGKSRIIKP